MGYAEQCADAEQAGKSAKLVIEQRERIALLEKLLKDRFLIFKKVVRKLRDERERIEKLEKALEFYAAIACPLPKVLGDNEEIKEMKYMDNAPYYRGGMRARQALNKITGEGDGDD